MATHPKDRMKSVTAKGANPATKKVLGRGLAALMAASAVKVDSAPKAEHAGRKPSPDHFPHESVDVAQPKWQVPVADGGVMSVSHDSIVPNASQPRRHFAEAELEELAQSLRTSGLLQPILVRKLANEGEESRFEIVAGERRWRAAALAGLSEVPVILRDLTDREAFAAALIENVQRADLNPIEEALAYQRLVDEFNETQSDVAKSVGKDRVSVANALRLLKLPKKIQDLLVTGALTSGHGRALLMVTAPRVQEELAEEIIRNGLSVREAERRAAGEGATEGENVPVKKPTQTPEKHPSISEVEERLRRALGTKVSVRVKGKGRGDVHIHFFSAEELEQLLERLGA